MRWSLTYLYVWLESVWHDFPAHHEYAKHAADLAVRKRLL